MLSFLIDVRQYSQFLSRCAPVLVLTLLLATVVFPQGSGSTGTGGKHIIQGKIFFPSGHKAEGSIQVKLQSFTYADISAMTDSSGSFVFSSLLPGNYTVVVSAGDEFEIARESVTIDSDLNVDRSGMPVNQPPRRYSVMITLQLKPDSGNHTKPSVINAALAEVPDAARDLYQKALDFVRAGDIAKAIDNLKAAISLYPKFPLALNELGVQYLRLGQASKAVEPLKSATNLNPDASAPKLNLGIALLESQQYAEAEQQLREVLRKSPTPIAHMYLGLTLAQLRNDLDAEKELKTAVESGGDQLPLAHYYLGGLYWRKGDMLRKEKAGEVLVWKKEYRLAADELEIYLRLSPNAPDAERVRGTIRELRGKS
jgi:Flp pilus assembly protein TadD